MKKPLTLRTALRRRWLVFPLFVVTIAGLAWFGLSYSQFHVRKTADGWKCIGRTIKYDKEPWNIRPLVSGSNLIIVQKRLRPTRKMGFTRDVYTLKALSLGDGSVVYTKKLEIDGLPFQVIKPLSWKDGLVLYGYTQPKPPDIMSFNMNYECIVLDSKGNRVSRISGKLPSSVAVYEEKDLLLYPTGEKGSVVIRAVELPSGDHRFEHIVPGIVRQMICDDKGNLFLLLSSDDEGIGGIAKFSIDPWKQLWRAEIPAGQQGRGLQGLLRQNDLVYYSVLTEDPPGSGRILGLEWVNTRAVDAESGVWKSDPPECDSYGLEAVGPDRISYHITKTESGILVKSRKHGME